MQKHYGVLLALALSVPGSHQMPAKANADVDRNGPQAFWIGTWAAAPQPPVPGRVETFRNQSLRLVVHTSTGGAKVRIRLSNAFADQPLVIGSAHVARRTAEADVDVASDRALTFRGQP